ncbi:unnamed protein product [Hermetia illucens]|uniref:Homeobox domain-containing protein n=1 Tax=Hermetia illucens TaxID=343691 RepID=A0A7R8UMM6_HERIL|nr:unnamed protein product [Hermetia illucens]
MTKSKQLGKPKRIRTRFTESQLEGLTEFYEQNLKECTKLTKSDYDRMGKILGLDPQKVQSFMNNRRHLDIVAGKRAPRRLQHGPRSVDSPVKTTNKVTAGKRTIHSNSIQPIEKEVTTTLNNSTEWDEYNIPKDDYVFPTMVTTPPCQNFTQIQGPMHGSMYPTVNPYFGIAIGSADQRDTLSMYSSPAEPTHMPFTDNSQVQGYHYDSFDQFPNFLAAPNPTKVVAGQPYPGHSYGHNAQINGYYSKGYEHSVGGQAAPGHASSVVTEPTTSSEKTNLNYGLPELIGSCLGYMTERIFGDIGE